MAMTWGKRRALVIGLVILFFILIIWAASKPVRLASNSVLVLDAEGEIEEQRPNDFFSAFSAHPVPVLHDFTDAIDAARTDSRITGIAVRVAPLETGWGKLEEIRAHLLDFRKSGKPSVCYLGYDGIGNREYYLASACQQIWLVPQTPLNIHGMMAEAIFLRGTLDKLKIVPEFYHVAEYKTAGNLYTEKKFTPAHREEVEALLHSIYDRYLTDVAQARSMDRAKLEALVARGPLTPSEAVENKLVDRLGYWDQVQDYFNKHGNGWNPVSLTRYRGFSGWSGGGQKIAVVQATGLIVSGQSQNTAGGGFVMGGDSVAADIRRARRDSSIKAIVLRVDSGGGSAVGSEVIRREVELATADKPVVVSMSDVAASGGYWIAMGANKIVADPNTITGSIGVLIGKLNISGLYNLLGISTDYVATSDNATIFWDQQNFSPAQREYIQKFLKETYAQFIRGVASGRKMTVEQVDKIGKGRVWSGAQAKELGLVDDLGGLDRAIEVAKKLAHIPAGESVRIVRLPEEKTFFQVLFEREKEQFAETRSLHDALQRIVGTMEPVQARIPFELHIF
jgi:protease-4